MLDSPTPLTRLPEALRDFRIRARLTQKELASAADVKLMVISNYERGHTLPRLDSLDKILIALELNLSDFALALEQIQQGQSSPSRPRRVRRNPGPEARPLSGPADLTEGLILTLRAITDGLHSSRRGSSGSQAE